MATSPSHKFGQDLGNLLEHLVLYRILKPRLEAFAKTKNYYLDWQKERPTRKGKKVTWSDKYGNNHDLDFVIELDGSDTRLGRPIAFIEAAWRRYTKHSKNKAQEIQGAILPIIELHHLSAPFYGAVLAGEFTKPALEQLRNNKFTVLYIPYKNVIKAFNEIGFDIAFDEATSDKIYDKANKRLSNITDEDIDTICRALIDASKNEIDSFIGVLQATLERIITQIILIPLFGKEIKCKTITEAMNGLSKIDYEISTEKLHKIEIIVDYSNGSTIRATFNDENEVKDFLQSIKKDSV